MPRVGEYTEKIYDCPNCGHKDISALRFLKCPQCGATPPGQEYERITYRVITDPEGLRLAKGGPHWVCSNCFSKNFDEHDMCQYCGNPKDPSDPRYKVKRLDLPEQSESSVSSFSPAQVAPRPTARQRSTSPRIQSYSSLPRARTATEVSSGFADIGAFVWQYKWLIGFVTVAAVLLGAFLYAKYHTEAGEGTVTRLTWSRTLSIYRYEVVHYTGKGSSPLGAYNVQSHTTSKQEPRYRTETETVEKTCPEDQANGSVKWVDCSYEVSKEVFDHYETVTTTTYDYDINEWVYKFPVSTNGEGREPAPYWPEYHLNLEGQQVLGAEKATGSESYVVYFNVTINEEDKQVTYTTSNQAEWTQYLVEARYPLKVNKFNEVMNNPYQDKINAIATAEAQAVQP